uniref:Uncharacterized protein n=1 Tax=Caenorhabditis japonica TaxID=281687 RepID=A0A8R1DGI0_CAEJA
MLAEFSLCLILFSATTTVVVEAYRGSPELRVHEGHLNIHDLGSMNQRVITEYRVGQEYTFEVFLDETTMHDYMIERCTMNGDEIIGQYGCVQCGSCFTQTVETESYNKPGAVKRTMISFVATSTSHIFDCQLKHIDCSGCAERSCQRQDQIALSHFHYQDMELHYPPNGYGAGAAFPIPIPPPPSNVYPSPPFGGAYNVPPPPPPPQSPGVVPPPPVQPIIPGAPGAAAAGAVSGAAGVWPWWLWLLILLLLLLLLCCLLALCFAAFMKRRRERRDATTVTVVDSSGKDCAVGTDKVSVNCVATDTQDMVKVQPAVVVGATDLESHHHQHSQNQYSRSQGEYDQGSVMAGGSYSVREGMVHEGYTRTIPSRSDYQTNQRYASREASRDRFERQSHENGQFNDRSSYRNFAYERDMGRVEPMDGYDEVETRERTYCLSDDEGEIVEKNVKRTHTTRYVTESREYEHDNEERLRGDDYHHATYTHSLPV